MSETFPDPAPPNNPPKAATPPRKRKSWLRRFMVAGLVVVVILAALIGFAPAIASNPAVTSTLMGFVNGQLRGALAVDRLSLSWGGPLVVEGLKVVDPDQRDAIRVARASCTSGLWALATAWRHFGEVRLEQPSVTVRIGPDGENSLLNALSPKSPVARDKEAGPLPDLHGRLVIVDGAAEVIREGSPRYALADLGLDVTLNGLGDIRGDLRAAQTSPLEAQVTTQIESRDSVNTATLKVAGPAGQLDAQITAALAGPSELSAQRLLSALLTGENVALPEFSVDAQGGLDLAEVGRLSPELLNVREGQRLTSGRLDIHRLAIHGGAAPKAEASIELTGLATEGAGGGARLEPVTLSLEAGLVPKKGLELNSAKLTSSFAQLDGKGDVNDLATTFRCDLTKMRRELGQIFDFGAVELDGQLSGALSAARPEKERVTLRLEATVDNMRYARSERRFELKQTRLTHEGSLRLDGARPTRFEASSLQVDLDGQVVASGRGAYDFSSGAWNGDIELKQAELKFLADRANAIGAPELARYAGQLSGTIAVEQPGSGRPIASHGAALARNLTVDAKPLLEREAKLEWAGVTLAPDASAAALARLAMSSAIGAIEATGVRWQGGDKMTLQGVVTASADLRPALRAAALVTKTEKPPAIGGHLNWTTNLATAGEVTLEGQGVIDNLEIGEGAQIVREKNVQLAYGAKLNQAERRFALNEFKLAAAPLSAEASGAVERYDADAAVSLKGSYSANWPAITAMLNELSPSSAKLLLVNGVSRAEFTLNGPANSPTARPAFRGLSGGTSLAWDSATIVGVELGAAKLDPKLADGVLSLAPVRISASGGAVNLAGQIDFRESEPTLRIPGKIQALDRVPITPLLASEGLSRLNPIFLGFAQVNGHVLLDVQDWIMPLGDSMKRAGAGVGRLDMSTIEVQPGGFLAELLALGGYSDQRMYTVRAGVVDFKMKDGRLHYDNFTLTFPEEFDLKFYGSVGFDETLDLVVSIPIRPELLEKLGVKLAAAEIVKRLAGTRIDIPIVGTRTQPKLDLSRVDKSKLLRGLVPAQPDKALEGLLEGLGGLPGQKPKDQPPAKNPRKRP